MARHKITIMCCKQNGIIRGFASSQADIRELQRKFHTSFQIEVHDVVLTHRGLVEFLNQIYAEATASPQFVALVHQTTKLFLEAQLAKKES